MKKYLVLFVSICLLSSCIQDIDFDNGREKVLVLNCLLKNDTIQTLRLTKSISLNSHRTYEKVTEADIQLFVGDSMVGKFVYNGINKWELNYTPIDSTEYKIVAIVGDTTLTATTIMPGRNSIVSNQTLDSYPTKNFKLYSAAYPTWITVINSANILLSASKPTSKDQACNDIGTDNKLVDKFNQFGNLKLTISEANTPAYHYYIRLYNDDTLNEENPIDFVVEAGYEDFVYVSFITASFEYDQYLKTSLQKVLSVADDTDPAIWFDESSIYSNIKNGKGIFGAYNEKFFRYDFNNRI